MTKKRVFRVVFHCQGNIYELHARHVSHGEMYGFVEIDDIIFGERTALLVDPSEEKLKSEFEGVKRTFVPMHAVIRIDEVEKEGANKVVASADAAGGKVTPFPMPMYTPGGDGGKKS
ncbi:MAG: DUF1820 family protein [Gammaproteobacteria bacterium]|nr:DUF1820 family protein [Gammaproteobacteria bacterium]